MRGDRKQEKKQSAVEKEAGEREGQHVGKGVKRCAPAGRLTTRECAGDEQAKYRSWQRLVCTPGAHVCRCCVAASRMLLLLNKCWQAVQSKPADCCLWAVGMHRQLRNWCCTN